MSAVTALTNSADLAIHLMAVLATNPQQDCRWALTGKEIYENLSDSRYRGYFKHPLDGINLCDWQKINYMVSYHKQATKWPNSEKYLPLVKCGKYTK